MKGLVIMDKDKTRGYTARIAQADRSELVNIVYELFGYSMDVAEKAFDEGDRETAVKSLKKAQQCVCELIRSLDFHYELSYNLAALYRYVHGQVIASITRREPVNFDQVNKIMGALGYAFSEVSKQDNSGPVMQNTQQVYAGLTYGRGKLDEVFMNANERSRGFMA